MFTYMKIEILSPSCRDCPGIDEVKMQVLCKKTIGNAEAHCCVCGQGFVMFWDRQSRSERITALHEIQQVLRHHHHKAAGPDAHPNESFPVPEWGGAAARSGAAIQRNAAPIKVSTLNV
jgi:hypothetical protein